MNEKKPSWAVRQIKRASGLLEWLCEHGVGHPSMKQPKSFKKVDDWSIHGCDGCCNDKTLTKLEEVSKQERQAVRREAVNTSKEGGALSAPSAPESLMPRCKKHNARHRRLRPFKSCKYDGEKITLVKIK